MPEQLTFIPDDFDEQLIEILDTLEQQVREVDLTSTPEYVFRKTVWALLLQKHGNNDYANCAWSMTVDISGLDMSRENDKNKLRYFAERWAVVVDSALSRLKANTDIPRSAYDSALSRISFTYNV